MSDTPHISVLLPEVLSALGDISGKVVIDATFGAGGYSRAFLSAGAKVIAFDRDIRVAPYVQALKAEFGEALTWVNRPFSEMVEGLADIGIEAVDAIVMDIGVSSMQLDEAERGFSFMRDGPLDMRMSDHGRSAADIVNEDSAEDIAHILYTYGDERKSRHIANVIVRRRETKPFTRTLDLAEQIEFALGGRRGAPTHPATRSFQALRIAVNDELGELETALEASKTLLVSGGILAVVTFHSLEDRLVKTFMTNETGNAPSGSRHVPQSLNLAKPVFDLALPKAVAASKSECEQNPRARSAKLRAVKRTATPYSPSQSKPLSRRNAR